MGSVADAALATAAAAASAATSVAATAADGIFISPPNESSNRADGYAVAERGGRKNVEQRY